MGGTKALWAEPTPRGRGYGGAVGPAGCLVAILRHCGRGYDLGVELMIGGGAYGLHCRACKWDEGVVGGAYDLRGVATDEWAEHMARGCG